VVVRRMKLNPLRWIWDAFLGPADDAPKDDREPVFLAGPYHEFEAEIVKSKIEGSGMPVLVKSRSSHREMMMGTGLATYDIWVRYRDADAAREVLGLVGAAADETKASADE
jgi:hypothetical protein